MSMPEVVLWHTSKRTGAELPTACAEVHDSTKDLILCGSSPSRRLCTATDPLHEPARTDRLHQQGAYLKAQLLWGMAGHTHCAHSTG
jgi:hypothetical protein